MALVECRECGAKVSSRAKKCPQCGISKPGQSKLAVAAAIVCFVFALMLIMRLGGGSGAVRPTPGASPQSNFVKIPDPQVFYMPSDGRISDDDRWAQERVIRYAALQHLAARYGNCKLIPDASVSDVTIKSSNFENKSENIELYRKFGMSDNQINEAIDRVIDFNRENHDDFEQCASINKSYVEAISNFIDSGADPYTLSQYFSG